MADTGFLPKDKIKTLLEKLSNKYRVFAPVQQTDVVTFKHLDQGEPLCFGRPANLPPKAIIFPQSDTLFRFDFHKDPEDPKKVSVALKEKLEFPDTVIFGCRPCDAAGFTIYDRVYLEGETADPYYQGRREKTTIVTLSCNAPSPGCFCTAVGGGPASSEGADALMTELADGYYFEALTDKGKALVREGALGEGGSHQDKAREVQKKTTEGVRKPIAVTDDLPQKIFSLFDNDAFWENESAKCISCGACTYLCPTCYCFNITDEQVANTGERIRSWDACMFSHFTLEASGHNPRPHKHQRLKNRVGHKFSYYPAKYAGFTACCGCGRCIRYCPVSVDISEIVAHCQEHNE